MEQFPQAYKGAINQFSLASGCKSRRWRSETEVLSAASEKQLLMDTGSYCILGLCLNAVQ